MKLKIEATASKMSEIKELLSEVATLGYEAEVEITYLPDTSTTVCYPFDDLDDPSSFQLI